MYLRDLPLAKDRTEIYYHHAGASLPETMFFWGTPNMNDFGWNNSTNEIQSRWQRYHIQGTLEVISQMLDVYQNASTPQGSRAPVLVYMHGGAWNHGERPASWHGFRAWMAAGFSVVNVEYRLADVAPAPAAVQDVRCALNWILQNAAKYNFDTNRVVTYGTSAGGHLALMAAVLPVGRPIRQFKR